ncbi:lipid scramblase CLPTM1L-like [Styela clava]|uniref:cleft lip and palate transmembrane protein 1-like protein n=1 Tax=Styela clava TaxID=7725 RepID=UPI0019396D96|nr:cleft lip and palate transmembrane protein 1-like protein [Styela clava]
MKFLSLTTLALALVTAYICNTVWVMYTLWNPKECSSQNRGMCLTSYGSNKVKWNLKVYCTKKKKVSNYSKNDLVWELKDVDFQSKITESVTIPLSLPKHSSTRLYFHVVVHENEQSKTGEFSVHQSTNITKYSKPLTYFKLVDDKNETKSNSTDQVLHWRTKMNVHVMHPFFNFDRTEFPMEIFKYIKQTKSGNYLPVLFIDELAYLKSDLKEIKQDMTNISVDITYSPISIGKLRLWTNLLVSMQSMRELGFTEEDTEQIRGLFTDTNIMFLALTFFVSTFHLLFEFLAFKHDVHYWKERKTMEGLSLNTVIYRCVSTFIIFLYLMDEQTSYIVLVPAGIGSIIEIWKVTKALKVKIIKNGWKFSVQFGTLSGKEKTTDNYDHQAIKYLSYILYPLSVFGAIYSLFYVPQKGWYSWVINSLVNGVYAFGFLFMLPQLFINYKLKSVAHLPWKAFTYKAFNTFIDDVFAFIIKMPTSHRIACFRDDVVFFCYLYQRWLYPVDKKRANEYGISYEEDKKEK